MYLEKKEEFLKEQNLDFYQDYEMPNHKSFLNSMKEKSRLKKNK